MIIEDADIFVRVVPFPTNVPSNGMCVLNEDGTYSVYLDANASIYQRKAAYVHELNHILKNHMHEGTIADAEQLR